MTEVSKNVNDTKSNEFVIRRVAAMAAMARHRAAMARHRYRKGAGKPEA